jgi:hypothetical protein
MTDTRDNALENIAYELFTHIAYAEKKAISPGQIGDLPTKSWILDTYTECLKAVQAPQPAGRM